MCFHCLQGPQLALAGAGSGTAHAFPEMHDDALLTHSKIGHGTVLFVPAQTGLQVLADFQVGNSLPTPARSPPHCLLCKS